MKGLTSRGVGFVAVLGAVVALAGALVFSSGVWAQAPYLSIGSLSTSVGLEGTVSLQALDIGAPGLGAWTIDVAYDQSVVSVVDCTAEEGGICNPAYAEETVRVAGMNVFGLEGDSILATMAFACESVGSSDLTLSAPVLVDATPGKPQPVDATIANGSVTCTAEEVEPTPSPTPTGTPEPAELPGDANCDGAVNAIDAFFVLQSEAGLILSLACQDAADVNEDGIVNTVDAALILQYDAGLIDSLPPPAAAGQGWVARIRSWFSLP